MDWTCKYFLFRLYSIMEVSVPCAQSITHSILAIDSWQIIKSFDWAIFAVSQILVARFNHSRSVQLESLPLFLNKTLQKSILAIFALPNPYYSKKLIEINILFVIMICFAIRKIHTYEKRLQTISHLSNVPQKFESFDCKRLHLAVKYKCHLFGGWN